MSHKKIRIFRKFPLNGAWFIEGQSQVMGLNLIIELAIEGKIDSQSGLVINLTDVKEQTDCALSTIQNTNFYHSLQLDMAHFSEVAFSKSFADFVSRNLDFKEGKLKAIKVYFDTNTFCEVLID